MQLSFSLIIPVYNRPEEIKELLESLVTQTYSEKYEVVILEDGSQNPSEDIAKSYEEKINIQYYFKENSGPGDSRNFGMKKARGNYFIILDSDCLLPPNYLAVIHASLTEDYVDFFGGPDTAHPDFTITQKAINYAMTAMLTTGGLRGNKKSTEKFQPRSFNMGISREAFERSEGFGRIHPGEDPDLTFRLWKLGYKSKLIPEAVVHHKRRIDFKKFYSQVKKFGMVRPILNKWHSGTARLSYWLPTLFISGMVFAVILALLGNPVLILAYLFYFIVVFIDSLYKNRTITIALMSVFAVLIQFIAYGLGFFKSTFLLTFSRKKPQELFPALFFKEQE
ncbi:glycosyltransferase [Muriicola soli]|uniref:Glycosyltransferase n=1 Tax=Muriicola soli TaxID=2507538 RepID=A0A411E9K8_9FLAO|nr:glycosyltransferase [Muriicola soli]QBA64369.1 glycosyltransferase [Muriicola soli]